MIHFDEEKSNKKLEQFREQEEEDLAQILSDRHKIPYVNLANTAIKTDALSLIPEEKAREWKVASFDIVNKRIALGVLSPTRDTTQMAIDLLTQKGYQPDIYIVTQKSLEKAWSRYVDVKIATESTRGLLKISGEEIERILEEVTSPQAVTQLINKTVNLKRNRQITSIVEIIVAGAVSLFASDIHIEPGETDVEFRLRIDGLLVPIIAFDDSTYKLLLSRIKLLSGIKINIKNKAQDGRFSIKIGDREIEIRTSVIPGAYGEAIVLRVLDPLSIKLTLTDLGLDDYVLEIIKKELEKPNGLILNTGPTGSGKTTTLYAFLEHLHRPDIKILTIEDPVEYHVDGLVQTQVDRSKNYTFATGLNSALRQDPDVIMVGEIRDAETADTAIQAALTGHLVFSTLHTNSAIGTFPRLLELGINPNLFGPAIRIVMAQRLVRTLCPDSREEVPIAPEERALMERIIAGSPRQDLFEPFLPLNTIFKAKPSETCPTGYRHRIGVFEVVLMTNELAKLIKKDAGEEELRKAAFDQKMVTMAEAGILKVLQGITDIDELKRVIDLS